MAVFKNRFSSKSKTNIKQKCSSRRRTNMRGGAASHTTLKRSPISGPRGIITPVVGLEGKTGTIKRGPTPPPEIPEFHQVKLKTTKGININASSAPVKLEPMSFSSLTPGVFTPTSKVVSKLSGKPTISTHPVLLPEVSDRNRFQPSSLSQSNVNLLQSLKKPITSAQLRTEMNITEKQIANEIARSLNAKSKKPVETFELLRKNQRTRFVNNSLLPIPNVLRTSTGYPKAKLLTRITPEQKTNSYRLIEMSEAEISGAREKNEAQSQALFELVSKKRNAGAKLLKPPLNTPSTNSGYLNLNNYTVEAKSKGQIEIESKARSANVLSNKLHQAEAQTKQILAELANLKREKEKSNTYHSIQQVEAQSTASKNKMIAESAKRVAEQIMVERNTAIAERNLHRQNAIKRVDNAEKKVMEVEKKMARAIDNATAVINELEKNPNLYSTKITELVKKESSANEAYTKLLEAQQSLDTELKTTKAELNQAKLDLADYKETMIEQVTIVDNLNKQIKELNNDQTIDIAKKAKIIIDLKAQLIEANRKKMIEIQKVNDLNAQIVDLQLEIGTFRDNASIIENTQNKLNLVSSQLTDAYKAKAQSMSQTTAKSEAFTGFNGLNE